MSMNALRVLPRLARVMLVSGPTFIRELKMQAEHLALFLSVKIVHNFFEDPTLHWKESTKTSVWPVVKGVKG
jgi:hypothetical protein